MKTAYPTAHQVLTNASNGRNKQKPKPLLEQLLIELYKIHPIEPDLTVVGEVKRRDGSFVKKYKDVLFLPIETHHPHNYIIINTESEQIWTCDPDDPTRTAPPSNEDKQRIANVVRRLLRHYLKKR